MATPSETGTTDGKPSQFRTPSASYTGLKHALLSQIHRLYPLQPSAYVIHAAKRLVSRSSGASGSFGSRNQAQR